jgi:hypothetical protein
MQGRRNKEKRQQLEVRWNCLVVMITATVRLFVANFN